MKIKEVLCMILILVNSIAFCQTKSETYKPIKWNRIKNEAELKKILLNSLPKIPEPIDIIAFLDKQKITHSELEDGVIYASAKVKSDKPLIEKTWLMEFQFDDSNRFIELVVKAAYTGH